MKLTNCLEQHAETKKSTRALLRLFPSYLFFLKTKLEIKLNQKNPKKKKIRGGTNHSLNIYLFSNIF